MSYTKTDQTPFAGNLAAGETVVALDTGDLVATQCSADRNAMSNLMVFVPSARWVDTAGVTRHDTTTRAVAVAQSLTISPDDVNRLGADVVTRQCLMLVLGEPLAPDPDHPETNLLHWSDSLIAQCNIRNAIAAASVIAPGAEEVL